MVTNKNIISDLGDGLILRRAKVEDTDALAKFNGNVHGENEYAMFLDTLVREMMSGAHPHIGPEDFTIVEEVETGKIVSSLNLIQQIWTYDGIEFGVGRPELVGTLEDYRRKGLVRKQMDLVHKWSKEKGHLVQVITGIPWYYRMFGYEMTVNLGGGQELDVRKVPKLKEYEQETVSFRNASLDDIPFIKKLYDHSNERSLLSCIRSSEMWKHDISGRFDGSMGHMHIVVIENSSGEPIGFFMHGVRLCGTRVPVILFELDQGISWLDVSPAIFRYMKKTSQEILVTANEKLKKKSKENKKAFIPRELRNIYFRFGEEHPVFSMFPNLFGKKENPYSWYIRVPDLPAFLNLIKSVLEKRLSESYLLGYSGELKLNFYKTGTLIKFEKGTIASIENFENPDAEKTDASFPDLKFLHLLFGSKSIDELKNSNPDCFISHKKPEALVLLRILFPKKNSNILPIE